MSTQMAPLPPNYQSMLAQNDFGPLFEKYKITYGLALEFIQDTLYDTVTYISTTTTVLPVLALGALGKRSVDHPSAKDQSSSNTV